MKRFLPLLLSVGLTLVAVFLMPAMAQAAISSHVWLNTAYKGYDGYYDSTVVAYEAGSTATVEIQISNNTGDPVSVKAASLHFDWADGDYAATDYPANLGEGETGYITFVFTVPDTSVASNLFTHSYTIDVDYDHPEGSPNDIGISYENAFVGIGNGIRTQFELAHEPVLPGSVHVYLDGAPTTDYVVNYRTGRLDFNIAPGVGVEITADYRQIEFVGNGDGSETVFHLDHPPVAPASEQIFLDGILSTAYSIDYHSGEVTFTAAPAEGVAITAEYQTLESWHSGGSGFAVYSFDQYDAMNLKQQAEAIGTPDVGTVRSRELLAESDMEKQLADQQYVAGNFEGAKTHYQAALDLRQDALSRDKNPNTYSMMAPWGMLLTGVGIMLLTIGVLIYGIRRLRA